MKGGASGQGCAALEVYAADLACAAGVRVHVGHDCVCSLDVKKFMFVMSSGEAIYTSGSDGGSYHRTYLDLTVLRLIYGVKISTPGSSTKQIDSFYRSNLQRNNSDSTVPFSNFVDK